jgi:hypothetical protein
MPGREVERVEVVARRLDLAAVDDLVAEPEEYVLHLASDLRDEVKVTAPRALARERHVDRVLAQLPLELRRLERCTPVGDPGLEPVAEGVQRHAGLAVTDGAQRLRQLGFPPQIADPQLLDLLDRRGALDGAQRLRLERLHVHRASVPSPS